LNFFAYCQIIFIEYHLGLRVWWAAYPVLQNRGGDDGSGADIGHFPPFAVTSEGVADFYICSLHPILCPFHYRVDPLFNPGQPLMQPRDIGAQLFKFFQPDLASSGGRIGVVSFFFYDLGTQIDAFVANENRGSRDQFGDFMLALAAEGTIASTGHFRLIALDQVTDDRRQFTAQLFESFTFGVDAKQVAGFNKPALGLGIVIDIEFYHSANLPFDSIIAPAIPEPHRAIFKSASGLPRTKMACGGRRGTGHGLLKTIAIPSKAAAATTATAHRINLRFSILISSVARFEWS
jgi:hypothetical protein